MDTSPVSESDQERHRRFMQDQCRECETHKWILGEKIGRDPGHQAVMDWVHKYSRDFRAYWESLHGQVFKRDS